MSACTFSLLLLPLDCINENTALSQSQQQQQYQQNALLRNTDFPSSMYLNKDWCCRHLNLCVLQSSECYYIIAFYLQENYSALWQRCGLRCIALIIYLIVAHTHR